MPRFHFFVPEPWKDGGGINRWVNINDDQTLTTALIAELAWVRPPLQTLLRLHGIRCPEDVRIAYLPNVWFHFLAWRQKVVN